VHAAGLVCDAVELNEEEVLRSRSLMMRSMIKQVPPVMAETGTPSTEASNALPTSPRATEVRGSKLETKEETLSVNSLLALTSLVLPSKLKRMNLLTRASASPPRLASTSRVSSAVAVFGSLSTRPIWRKGL